MLVIACIGFILGLLIPVISGRFGKILPADPGMVLLRLWHRPRFPRVPEVYLTRRLMQKWMKLAAFSIGWGAFMACLFLVLKIYMPKPFFVWSCVFSVILGFCFVVDRLYCLLPDFFTIPLLGLGFAAAVFTPVIAPVDSVMGAGFGYMIATVSVLLLGLFRQAELGAGDVKLMAAVGAWLGVIGLNFALFLSFFLFAVQTVISKKKNGPYGPALGVAALVVLFMLYA